LRRYLSFYLLVIDVVTAISHCADGKHHTNREATVMRQMGQAMRKRNPRRTVPTTTLIVFGAAMLAIVVLGRVVVVGQQRSISVEKTADENGLASTTKRNEGARLFRTETFGGNGRTCETCHSRSTGTLSLENVRELLEEDPGNPLFLHDGLDDGVAGTSRIAEHATIRIVRPLPPNVRIAEDPSATTVVLFRGIPTTINTPALDPALMYDLRARNLSDQALGAIHDHAQNTVEPTEEQLASIAEFQRTDKRFFSSDELHDFARGGPAPVLPPGRTLSEQRGRLMFVETEFTPGSAKGICALCHAGPMLNQTSPFNFGAPPGARIANIGVSERNLLHLPVHTFLIDDGTGDVRAVTTSDPGIPLTNPRPPGVPPPFIRHPAFFAGFFKIPSLWGVKRTAPYFHDNSANTLEEVAAFYTNLFANNTDFPVQLTPQDQVDMVAYLKLLR
jgi:cytochrome c peroxidase